MNPIIIISLILILIITGFLSDIIPDFKRWQRIKKAGKKELTWRIIQRLTMRGNDYYDKPIED